MMTTKWRYMLNWSLILLLPMPLAYLISQLAIGLVGADRIGEVNAWLADMYVMVGLRDVPYAFAWSWQTIYLVLIGFPYAMIVLAARLVWRNPGTRANLTWRWLIIIVLPAPVALLTARVLFPVVGVLLAPALHGFSPSYAAYFIVYDVGLLGVPYAVLSLLLHTLLAGRLRKPGPAQGIKSNGGQKQEQGPP